MNDVAMPSEQDLSMGEDQSQAMRLNENAQLAASQLRALGHEGRLMLLCHLSHNGEMTVGALETALGLRQAAVSQLLARLRTEGIVDFRRDGKSLHYRIIDERVHRLVGFLYNEYCA